MQLKQSLLEVFKLLTKQIYHAKFPTLFFYFQKKEYNFGISIEAAVDRTRQRGTDTYVPPIVLICLKFLERMFCFFFVFSPTIQVQLLKQLFFYSK